jgi:cell wall-associated NlpC family hydrolase
MPINRLSAFCVVAVAALLSGQAVQAHTGKSHAKPVHAKHVNHHHHSKTKLAHHKTSHGKSSHTRLARAVHHTVAVEPVTASVVTAPTQQVSAGFDFVSAPLAGAATSGILLSGDSVAQAAVRMPAWLNNDTVVSSRGMSFTVTHADAPLVFAATSTSNSAVATVTPADAEPVATANNSITDLRKALIAMAMNLRDIRYVRGGHDPSTGFDCSGFVRYVFAHAIGMQLPTNSASQFLAGLKVKRADMKPGDLVFFHTHGRRISHVGIYISDGRFIHSPATGKSVEISSLDEAYWSKRFAGAKRPEGMAMVASRG